MNSSVTTSDLETSNSKSDTIPSSELDYPPIVNKTPVTAKSVEKEEIANSVPQESLDREKEIKEIAEILLLCPETFPELQDLYGSETTGSYFIEIKQIRKFICEEGIYYAATL